MLSSKVAFAANKGIEYAIGNFDDAKKNIKPKWN